MRGVKIPFNRPYITGREIEYIRQTHAGGRLSGDGPFTKRCHIWLEENACSAKALLTHSCTAALEMAALLIDVKPGDEIIMPSFTFVSTANAFVLRGGVPVFVDIRPDTLNIDERLIEQAVTAKTRAIVAVHYAGVGCEMDAILEVAGRFGLYVIEDAAQGILARYKAKPLGAIGHLGAYSFHETKNIHSGEGGAILVNDPKFVEFAEIIREKGTDRARFFRGEVDKYTWRSIGSSYLPSEIVAAFLCAQLEQAESLTERRLSIWHQYHEAFAQIEQRRTVRRPVVPTHCQHNGHIYYLLLQSRAARDAAISTLSEAGVRAIFHYIPLHSSPAGRRFGRASGSLPITDRVADTIVRLPIWVGMDESHIQYVASAVQAVL